MNAVVLSVVVMLVLSVARVHVVLALFLGALVGGLAAGLGLEATMVAFQDGLAGGARIALSYALLGAFAMAVAHSGLPQLLATWLIRKLDGDDLSTSQKVTRWTTAGLLGGTLVMSIMSQNLIPVHIAFIPLLIPPLLIIMNRLRLDRRAVASVLTFGLVTTYMFLPIGFGKIFLSDILYGNIIASGLDVSDVNVMSAMGIPALGMVAGLLLAVFVTYRRPRDYDMDAVVDHDAPKEIKGFRIVVALVAIIVSFGVQAWLTFAGSDADALLVGALLGLCLFIITGAVKWRDADEVFTGGMRMMALIGLIMIAAQGFASVMRATDEIAPLVEGSAAIFGENRGMAAFVMLLVGLLVTMGIGSSFSTLPIITAIYVPLCVSLGFSPVATVAIIGTAGALGDAGSPASDSTLGPTAGLNADGQHDHIRDTVIPTFLHFNLPLLAAGWVAAMVL